MVLNQAHPAGPDQLAVRLFPGMFPGQRTFVLSCDLSRNSVEPMELCVGMACSGQSMELTDWRESRMAYGF